MTVVAVIDSETQIFSFISPCFKVRPPILWLKVRPLYPLTIPLPNFELIHQWPNFEAYMMIQHRDLQWRCVTFAIGHRIGWNLKEVVVSFVMSTYLQILVSGIIGIGITCWHASVLKNKTLRAHPPGQRLNVYSNCKVISMLCLDINLHILNFARKIEPLNYPKSM